MALVVFAIALLGFIGWRVYDSQTTTKKTADATSNGQTTSPSPSPASPTPSPATTQTTYLVIKEWGVKMPLSNAISDAYYVVGTTSKGFDGLPNQMQLGLKSLDISGCIATNYGITAPVLLFRTSLTETDSVTGKVISQEYSGTTIGSYFYGYSLNKAKPCDNPTTIQNLDSAMTNSIKGIVSASPD